MRVNYFRARSGMTFKKQTKTNQETNKNKTNNNNNKRGGGGGVYDKKHSFKDTRLSA